MPVWFVCNYIFGTFWLLDAILVHSGEKRKGPGFRCCFKNAPEHAALGRGDHKIKEKNCVKLSFVLRNHAQWTVTCLDVLFIYVCYMLWCVMCLYHLQTLFSKFSQGLWTIACGQHFLNPVRQIEITSYYIYYWAARDISLFDWLPMVYWMGFIQSSKFKNK